MTVVGFTGTRHGMSDAQRAEVAALMCGLQPTEVHHGDCVGADEEFHDIGVAKGLVPVIHPPVEDRLRAFCDGTVLPAKPYLVRNRDIVDACDVLIAAPFEFKEPGPRINGRRRQRPGRGGTWYTIRYAYSIGKPIIVVDVLGLRPEPREEPA